MTQSHNSSLGRPGIPKVPSNIELREILFHGRSRHGRLGTLDSTQSCTVTPRRDDSFPRQRKVGVQDRGFLVDGSLIGAKRQRNRSRADSRCDGEFTVLGLAVRCMGGRLDDGGSRPNVQPRGRGGHRGGGRERIRAEDRRHISPRGQLTWLAPATREKLSGPQHRQAAGPLLGARFLDERQRFSDRGRTHAPH